MNFTDSKKKLKKSFYTRDVLTVARELLGKILVKNDGKHLYAGTIVEVEAYDGYIDEAAHTFKGKTPRNQIMFEEGGLFYVYFTYGAHYCCNVVAGKKDHGSAVLIRAVEPLNEIPAMSFNRFGRQLKSDKEKYTLTNGPGKVCQAFQINRFHYGTDLTGEEIYLLNSPGLKDSQITETMRIGIKKSTELPWRFYITGNPYVSKK